MPLLQDLQGQTVLDIAFYTDNKSQKTIKQKIWDLLHVLFPVYKQSIFKKEKERLRFDERLIQYMNQSKINLFKGKSTKLNTSLASCIFANIQGYSYLHSSSVIEQSVIMALKI